MTETTSAGTTTGPSAGTSTETSAGATAGSADVEALSGDIATPDVVTPGFAVSALEQEGEVAADYLEGLLDITDLDGDIDMDVENERAMVSIVGGQLGHLVGEEGKVLDALQELTRLAVLRETGQRSRLMLDVDGYRAARRTELTELARQAVADVGSTGGPVRLAPMSPFERKVVHDAVASAGLRSESEGEEPDRRVVVHPG